MVGRMDDSTLTTCALKSRKSREGGTAMIEFIITLPVLLMLLFGIIEFSILFSRLQTVTNAAREGARDAVQSYASSGGVTVNAGDISVAGAYTGSGNNTTVQVVSSYAFQIIGVFAPALTPTINVTGTSVMRNE